MQHLFPDAEIVSEKFFGFTKSLIARRKKLTMRGLVKGLILGSILGLSITRADAATITTVTHEHNPDRIFIDVVGELVTGDDKAFEQVAATMGTRSDVIVTLAGPGGQVWPALKIGEFIHQHKWATLATSGNSCFSACATIWLSGVPRYIEGGPAVILGFHGVYNNDNKQESGVGNVVLGHYLTLWGLDDKGITCVTMASPDDALFLTGPNTKNCGIDYKVLSPSRTMALVVPDDKPPKSTRAEKLPPPPPAATRKYAIYQTSIDLTLRSAPDPHAAPVMDYLIPKGAEVRGWIDEKCQWWYGSGRGKMDADNLWCPVWYGDKEGWADAGFLLSNGAIVGCIDDPGRNGCNGSQPAPAANILPACNSQIVVDILKKIGASGDGRRTKNAHAGRAG